VGISTSVVQNLLLFRLKENPIIKVDELALKLGIILSCSFFMVKVKSNNRNPIFTDLCANEYAGNAALIEQE